MATKRIDQLTPASTLTGTELVPAEQGGVTVKTTAAAIAALGTPGIVTSGELADEVTARTAGDTTNATAIAAEAATRATADSGNVTAIATEATTRATADTANATAITTEATARAAADTAASSALSTEATTRAAADTTNASAITTEATTRAAADTANASAITAEATARATDVASVRPVIGDRIVHVTTTGNDANDGLGWGRAFATINAAIAAIGTAGGTINIGAGSFAPFEIDSRTVLVHGLHFQGQGTWRTIIQATATGEDCFVLKSGGTTSANFISFDRIGFVGTDGTSGTNITGHGLNLGGATYEQFGNVHVTNCRIERMGGYGVFTHDINQSLFQTMRIRYCASGGIYITGDPADAGTATLTLGNTCQFINVSLAYNGPYGIVLNQVGNSYVFIGGEIHYHTTDALLHVPGPSTRGVSFLGVHFENNARGAHLGNAASAGYTSQSVYFMGCHFTLNGAYDVYLQGVDGVSFETCQFGGTTAGLQIATGANRWEVRHCKASYNLFEDAAAVVRVAQDHWSQGGRIRLDTASTAHNDAVSNSQIYLRNTTSGSTTHEFIQLADSVGGCKIWMGGGSPEGVVTSTIGSLYLNRSGSVNTGVYYKSSGTGNTGWTAVGTTGSLAAANNLSDLASVSTARTNLGLGGAATLAVGVTAGTVAAGDDSRFGGSTSLGVGVIAGTVAAGNDTRFMTDRAGVQSTYYYAAHGTVGLQTLGNNQVVSQEFQFVEACTIDRIGIEVTTAGVAASVIRLGAYSDNGHGRPGALIADFGTVAVDSTGTKEITISQAIPAGLFHLVAAAQGGTPTVRGMSDAVMAAGSTSLATICAGSNRSYQQGSVTGALPNPMVPATATNVRPRIAVRVA